MKIYIIERDVNVQYRLQQIISSRNLGEVTGVSDNWREAFFYIEETGADVVLAGLALPQREALTFLEEAAKRLKDTVLLVLMQGGDSDMVRKAYEKGAEFVLHKPVCDLEIDRVLRSVELSGMMKWVLSKAGGEFLHKTPPVKPEAAKHGDQNFGPQIRHIKGVLRDIGILGEAGSKDILRIARYLMENDINFRDITLKELCGKMGHNAKSVEQRIRRAAMSGLANLARRGMEDYADPAFNEYAGKLYQYEQVKKEMNYILGKSELHGGIRLRKFMIGLLECCQTG